MNGLPPNIDLSFLRGIELLQVCVGLHEVILHFTSDVSITIQGRFDHVQPSADARTDETLPSRAASLLMLIGKQVGSVSHKTSGELKLGFSGNHWLTFFDDSPQYEAYTISHGEELIVV
jgi:hypothetical protein